MSELAKSSSFGPEAPPSPWRLDEVPAPILDSLVDALAGLALVSGERPPFHPRPFFEDASSCQPIPFTSELAAASLTNSIFRRNIFERKIARLLRLGSATEAATLCEKLLTETRSYVRFVRITFSGRSRTGSCRDYLGVLMKTLPNVQVVLDENGHLIRQWTPSPTTMRRIRIGFSSAPINPNPLSVKHLELLHIELPRPMTQEELSYLPVGAVSEWPILIGMICRNLKSLGELHLDLSKYEPRRLGDLLANVPVPGHLKALHLTVPYCDIQSDSQSKAQWEAYLLWLAGTEGRFECLTITFDWDIDRYIGGRDPDVSLSDVVESLGVRVDPEDSDHFSSKPLSMEFFQFSDRIFRQVPALTKIRLDFTFIACFPQSRPQTYMLLEIDRPRFHPEQVEASNQWRDCNEYVHASKILPIAEAIWSEANGGASFPRRHSRT